MIAQRRGYFRQDLDDCLRGSGPVVFFAGKLLLECKMRNLLKKILDIRRREPGCHFDDAIQIDLSGIELGKIMFKNRCPAPAGFNSSRYKAQVPRKRPWIDLWMFIWLYLEMAGSGSL